MPNKLNTWVHVGDKRYGPDDDVPQEIADQITNPGVWAEGGPADAVEVDVTVRSEPLLSTGEAPRRDRPPTRGPGSGRDAWATFARGEGVTVTDDMDRDAIAAAVDSKR